MGRGYHLCLHALRLVCSFARALLLNVAHDQFSLETLPVSDVARTRRACISLDDYRMDGLKIALFFWRVCDAAVCAPCSYAARCVCVFSTTVMSDWPSEKASVPAGTSASLESVCAFLVSVPLAHHYCRLDCCQKLLLRVSQA